MNALGILLFAALILFAIGLHEAGHFSTAKAFGIKVERFFIGFGPKLWSRTRGETEYGIAALPLGGYVRIAGMNPLEEIPEWERARTFGAKPAWQRAIVLVAGSFTHFLVAFLLYAALMAAVGVPEKITTTIDLVSATLAGKPSPAAVAGFKPGDRIVSAEGAQIGTWDQFVEFIRRNGGRSVDIEVVRDDRRLTLTATLATRDPEGNKRGFLGVQPEWENVRRSWPAAVSASGKMIGTTSWRSLEAFGRVLSPSTIGRLLSIAAGNRERTLDDPTSVVGATRIAGELASESNWLAIMHLFVAFNVFVGVVNLLPLPPLDGGHLAVLAYEQVRRRKVDMRKVMPVTAVVVAVLGTLFILLLYLDLVHPPTLPG